MKLTGTLNTLICPEFDFIFILNFHFLIQKKTQPYVHTYTSKNVPNACFSAYWDKLREHFNFVITIVLSRYHTCVSIYFKLHTSHIHKSSHTKSTIFNRVTQKKIYSVLCCLIIPPSCTSIAFSEESLCYIWPQMIF